MNYDKESVTKLLQSYRSKKRMIKQLTFELQNPSQISASELLRAMSIGGSGYGTVHSGGVSDKTMSVVAHYSETADRLNFETLEDIRRELRALVNETEKLELYVNLLDERQARIIQLQYLEGKSWNEIEKELNLSRSSIADIRRAGIDELVAMYGYITDVIKTKSE